MEITVTIKLSLVLKLWQKHFGIALTIDNRIKNFVPSTKGKNYNLK